MSSNIERIVWFYRRTGNTEWLLTSAVYNPNVTIICANQEYADKLNIRYYKLHKQLLWDNAPWYKKFTRFIIGWDYKYFCTLCKFPNFKSVDLVESLRGLNKPIVFDNSCLGIIN